MKRSTSLALGLAFALTLPLTGCEEKGTYTPPPPGMAGAPGVGGGANPGASPNDPSSWLPGANPTGADPHAGMQNPHAAGMPASAPATSQGADGRPQVIRGTGDMAAPAPAAGSKMVLTGTVTETMNAAGYTYMKVKSGTGDEMWAAVTETTVGVGDSVSLTESLTMTDFHSKSLNRTFDRILFATLNGAPVKAGAN